MGFLKLFIERNVRKWVKVKIIWIRWVEFIWFMWIRKANFFICGDHSLGLCVVVEWVLKDHFDLKWFWFHQQTVQIKFWLIRIDMSLVGNFSLIFSFKLIFWLWICGLVFWLQIFLDVSLYGLFFWSSRRNVFELELTLFLKARWFAF